MASVKNNQSIVKRFWLFTSVLIISGCTSYHALPLAQAPDLAPALTPDMLRDCPYDIDLTDGLNMTEVAALAITRDPSLAAIREKKNIARAQAFAAGLIPDPQFSGNIDHPTDSDPGLFNGYGAGLSFDLRSFVTRDVDRRIGFADIQSSDLDVLWQEWQTIERSRTLFVQKYFSQQRMALLERVLILAEKQADLSQKALRRGDTTLEQASADLAALSDVRGQVNAQMRAMLQTDQDLNAILRLSPDAVIKISDLGNPLFPTEQVVHKALTQISDRRPDLMALRAAYESQEMAFYKSVLQQFPSISISINHARDTSNVHTAGLGVTIDLPFFNGSRGDIAVQSATRQQMKQDYLAEIDAANGQALSLWRQIQMIYVQSSEMSHNLPALEKMAKGASGAYFSGDFPAASYLALENGVLAKKLEYIDLQETLWNDRIALDTVLGWPVLKNETGTKKDEKK